MIRKKKDSVPISRVPFLNNLSVRKAPAIYLVYKSPYSSSILPSVANMSSGQPSNDGIRELAASRRHSPMITHRLVVSYTTFSPLPQKVAVILFCLTLLSPIASTLGSGAPYAARTFLSHHNQCQRQSRNTAFGYKVNILY